MRLSQAAWQGLVVLMASALLVLKYETLTLRWSHNFTPINLKFGLGDKVRQVTSSAKSSSDPISSQDATWGNIYGYCEIV